MAKVLTSGVTLRKSNDFGDIHFFQAGETLPEWAENMVGEHLFQEDEGDDLEQRVETVDRSLPSGEPRPIQSPESLDVPRRSGSKADWAEFAEALDYTLPEEISRDEIVAMIENDHPELFE